MKSLSLYLSAPFHRLPVSLLLVLPMYLYVCVCMHVFDCLFTSVSKTVYVKLCICGNMISLHFQVCVSVCMFVCFLCVVYCQCIYICIVCVCVFVLSMYLYVCVCMHVFDSLFKSVCRIVYVNYVSVGICGNICLFIFYSMSVFLSVCKCITVLVYYSTYANST